MKLTIPKKQLKEALTAMSKVIHGKPRLPILSAVKITGTEDGTEVTGTNLDETLTCIIKGSDGGGSFIADLKELKDYLKAGGSTQVQFEDVGNKIAAIFHAGNIPVIKQFDQLPLDDWPETYTPFKGSKISEDVFANIRKAIPSASRDAARHILQSVLLEPNAIVATSGKDLIKLHCSTGVKNPTAVPVTKFLKAPSFEGPGTISVEERDNTKYCSIATDSWCYTVKCPVGTYPNYNQVIPKGSTSSIELSPEDIEYLKKGVPLLETLDHHNTVHLYADDTQVRVLPENLESTGLTVKGKFRGNAPVTVSVNRDLLIRCLDLGFRKLSFQSGDGFAPVTASDGKDLYVFMPLRGADTKRIKEAAQKECVGVNKEPGPTPVQKEAEQAPLNKEDIMPEKTKGFTVVGDAEKDPFEELLASIAETRDKAREVLDMTTELSRNVKAAQKAAKAKERDFKSTRDLLSKLKKVSGF